MKEFLNNLIADLKGISILSIVGYLVLAYFISVILLSFKESGFSWWDVIVFMFFISIAMLMVKSNLIPDDVRHSSPLHDSSRCSHCRKLRS